MWTAHGASVARFIQKGGSYVNYYMCHRGTNLSRGGHTSARGRARGCVSLQFIWPSDHAMYMWDGVVMLAVWCITKLSMDKSCYFGFPVRRLIEFIPSLSLWRWLIIVPVWVVLLDRDERSNLLTLPRVVEHAMTTHRRSSLQYLPILTTVNGSVSFMHNCCTYWHSNSLCYISKIKLLCSHHDIAFIDDRMNNVLYSWIWI